MEFHYNVYGCYREPYDDIELAKDAVDAGFEGIWIGDHFLPWVSNRPYTHHPFSWLGSLMNEIPDVPVGTSVTCPMIRYRPPLLAQSIATLDNMYPGRFNLGAGVGEALNEAQFIDGEWPSWSTRADMLIESIELMEELWTSDEYIEHDGEHFQYDGIKLHTNAKEHVNIHWAGWGPKSCQYAGKHADHLLTSADVDTIRETVVPNYEKGLAAAGRDRESRTVTNEVRANYGDPDSMVDEVREMGDYTPKSELGNPDPRDIQAVAHERLAEMSDEELQADMNMSDDPADFIAMIEELEDAGVDRVIIASNAGDPRATLEVFEAEVIPHFS